MKKLEELLEPSVYGYGKSIEISLAVSARRQADAWERIAAALEKIAEKLK